MSNTFENMFGNVSAKQRVCRVAYTINNAQPVACTIIGEEPLFYMDFEGALEDEEGHYDLMDMDALESELLILAQSIQAYDKFSASAGVSSADKLTVFADNAGLLSGEGNKAVQSSTDLLESLMVSLRSSRLAGAYMDLAAKHNIELVFSAQIETSSYERASGKILINPQLDRIDQILLTARELRRHYQHRMGALINPMMFHPDSAVLVNRAQSADLAASMVRIAWELQLAGQKEVWERVENSTMGDLARAFAREAFLDFRTINNGQASSAVFEGWFLSERCRAEDRKLIQHMLADYQGYVFDKEEAAKSVAPTLIAALGEMPFGKNYLANHAAAIMQDPVFTDVRDRSNANFLWFIKFERTFRETEHELQAGEVSPASDIRQGKNPTNKAEHHDAENTDNVVTLYEQKPITRLARKSRKNPGGDSSTQNVVYLRRGPGD